MVFPSESQLNTHGEINQYDSYTYSGANAIPIWA